MSCQDFLARFSEFYDGSLDATDKEDFRGHLEACRSCRRYLKVVERGTAQLRALPSLDVPPDFHPRLQHRIFHLADGHALDAGASGSATTAVTALAMAVLLAVAAWSPALLEPQPPEVELPPIVVSQPEARATFFPKSSAEALFSQRSPRLRGEASYGSLWSRPNSTLFQYSPLSERHRDTGLVRVGLD